MFDEIRYDGRDFQTKDFDCLIEQYVIEAGRLLKQGWRTVELPESEWVKYKDINYCQKTKSVPDKLQDTNFHGWVNFYTCNIDLQTGSPGKWEEYNAKFTDGMLVEVVAVPETPCQPGE